jgi:hypothetical protein
MRERECVVKTFGREPMRRRRLRADGCARRENASRRDHSSNPDSQEASRLKSLQEPQVEKP